MSSRFRGGQTGDASPVDASEGMVEAVLSSWGDLISVFVRMSGLLRHRIIGANSLIAGIPYVHVKTALMDDP